MHPMKFIPIYFERVWGGRALETRLKRQLPPEVRIGESREITDRAEAVSEIAEGDFRGQSLRSVLESHGAEIMGPHWSRERRFPLIVKWLDCASTSSIQVHPAAEAAARLGGEKKTEAWFFLHAEPSSVFFAGLNPGVTREELSRAAENAAIEGLVSRRRSEPDSCVLLEAGTVHAAGAGNLILEIQESSDTTYRLYDWNRRDGAGEPRALHIRESLESIDMEKNAKLSARRVPAGESGVLCACGSFSMRKVFLREGEAWRIAAGEQPRIIAMLDGEIVSSGTPPFTLSSSETALVPYSASAEFVAKRDSNLVVTENFNH